VIDIDRIDREEMPPRRLEAIGQKAGGCAPDVST
jgi:hypothetical protein